MAQGVAPVRVRSYPSLVANWGNGSGPYTALPLVWQRVGGIWLGYWAVDAPPIGPHCSEYDANPRLPTLTLALALASVAVGPPLEARYLYISMGPCFFFPP